jgi:hypothetical protein
LLASARRLPWSGRLKKTRPALSRSTEPQEGTDCLRF